MTGGRTRDLSGEMTFLGRSEVDEVDLSGEMTFLGRSEVDEVDLSGEVAFLGRSEVDDERVFTGVSSLSCKRRILTQKLETPEFVQY
jgi:hypothetical protein